MKGFDVNFPKLCVVVFKQLELNNENEKKRQIKEVHKKK